MKVAIRVDVCIRKASGDQLIRVVRRLAEVGAPATPCVSTGRDRSGQAAGRLLRDPAFMSRAWRMGALRTYGLRTALSGTLLPARSIVSESTWERISRWAQQGHEVALHGHDHRAWQDGIHQWSAERVAASFVASKAVFERFDIPVVGTAAPAWSTSPVALEIQDGLGLRWASDLRGRGPCRIRLPGASRPLATPQVSVNLPTLDELVADRSVSDPSRRLLDALETTRFDSNSDPIVYAAHPEVDGGRSFGAFSEFVDELRRSGARFSTLGDCFEGASLPERELKYAACRGRAFRVATDGSASETRAAAS